MQMQKIGMITERNSMKYNSKRYLALMLAATMTVSSVTPVAVGAQETVTETGTEVLAEKETVKETKTADEAEHQMKKQEQSGQEKKETLPGETVPTAGNESNQEMSEAKQDSSKTDSANTDNSGSESDGASENEMTEFVSAEENRETAADTSEASTEEVTAEQTDNTETAGAADPEQETGKQNTETASEASGTEDCENVTEAENAETASEKTDDTENAEVFPIESVTVTAGEEMLEVKLVTSTDAVSKIYIGKKEDSERTPEQIGMARSDGGYEFNFELAPELLGEEVLVVPYVTEEAAWYTEKDIKFQMPSEVEMPLMLLSDEQGEEGSSDTGSNSEIKEDGDYSIKVDTDNKMFKVIDTIISQKNGQITALITINSEKYDYVYVGTAEDAVKAGESNWIKEKDRVSYTSKGTVKKVPRFEIPVTKLGEAFTVVFRSTDEKNQEAPWKSYSLTFDADTVKSVGETLEEGEYTISAVTGSNMFKVIHTTLTKKNDKLTALITLSGKGADYLYKGSAEDAAKAEQSDWISNQGTAAYPDEKGELKEGYSFEIPLEKSEFGKAIQIASHSARNNIWYDRQLTFQSFTLEKIDSEGSNDPKETESETQPTESETNAPETDANTGKPETGEGTGTPDSETAVVDNSTTLADGIYQPEQFSFSGGSGKVTIACTKIVVENGKAYAYIRFSSSSYTSLKASGQRYAKRNDSGSYSEYVIPIQLNKDNPIIGTTTAMSTAKDVVYTIHAVLSETAQTESEKQTESESESEAQTESETQGGANVDLNQLQNGTYRVNVESSAKMFRVTNCVLTYKDGAMTAAITLSGTGYDKLFLGSAADAAKASADQLVGYTADAAGAYVFTIPVTALNTPIAVAAHSSKNDTWYDRELTFSSNGMQLIDLTQETEQTEKETEKKDDKKAEKESTYEKDLSGGTSRVDSSTGLADGVYTPDSFSWSGGSGRTSITCTKVTVTGGQAYATIVFGSSNYGYVKANGNKYFPTYGANTSSFTIPVKLNANNTIIGMTTAMSAAHEVTYSIYIYIAGADKKASGTETKVDKDKLSEEAPELIGLTYEEEEKIENAEYFRIYHYEQGITLIEVDMTSETEKTDSETTAAEEENTEKAETTAAEITDTDEETAENATDSELSDAENESEETKDALAELCELYKNKVVRYLVVPEEVEIPIALEKEMIVIQTPVESIYTDSEQAVTYLEQLEKEELITVKNEEAGTKPEYKELILNKCDLALLDDAFLEPDSESLFEEVTERLTTLGIPVLVDRSKQEESEAAQAEWLKVYGVIFGCQEEAKSCSCELEKRI